MGRLYHPHSTAVLVRSVCGSSVIKGFCARPGGMRHPDKGTKGDETPIRDPHGEGAEESQESEPESAEEPEAGPRLPYDTE